MKQIILPFHTGKPVLETVPAPVAQPGEVLIRTTASVVSTGTERMLMEFGQAGWLGKLRQQPEKVRQVLNKIRTDGLSPTISAVRRKLDQPIPLGYSQAGVVIGVGSGVHDIRPGDRVASNGPHAEVVSVPRNLLAKIPDHVPDEEAAFTVLGAVALQGIRLAAPTFGETVVVFGLGLIGQLTARLLMANGCVVIGADLNPERMRLAASSGVQILSEVTGESVSALTGGRGADAVLITTSGNSNGIIATAADMCRKRGRIVLTGVTGMNLSREQFFRKELTFQVSSSYGPGRYEPGYEQHGLDYPIGYVRWTEGRNFDAVLQAMASGALHVGPLITARYRIEEAVDAYAALDKHDSLATVFSYPGGPDADNKKDEAPKVTGRSEGSIAVIGAGSFTAGILLPALKSAGADISIIVSKSGLTAATLAKKWGIAQAGTDYPAVLTGGQAASVVIVTPHDTHAAMTASALNAGMHVLVEKPLALSRSEVDHVRAALSTTTASLTVGFNRRFAALALQAKNLLSTQQGPLNMSITVNAGFIPQDHWTQDALTGGGRILGEACHFVDLCAFFTGSAITAVCAGAPDGSPDLPNDSVSILLHFADGSNAAVNYFSNGSKAYSKERIELYRSGKTIVIDNWRTLQSFGFRKDISRKERQDKGHEALIRAWVAQTTEGGPAIMDEAQIINSTLATIAAVESLRQLGWISV